MLKESQVLEQGKFITHVPTETWSFCTLEHFVFIGIWPVAVYIRANEHHPVADRIWLLLRDLLPARYNYFVIPNLVNIMTDETLVLDIIGFFCPITFPASSLMSSMMPYRCVILFLLRTKLNEVRHVRFFILILVEFNDNSTPWFCTSPIFDITVEYR